MKNRNNIITTILLALNLFALCPITQAVSPAPDGGYAGGNTAEGQNALLGLSSGTYNTAVGFLSLESNTIGNFNTAIGAGTLLATTGEENTATGAGALLSNSTGADNTANGVFTLFSNTEGHDNTATGDFALFSNTTGSNNTASGRLALYSNTTAEANVAIGAFALQNSVTGSNNTAIGLNAGLNQTSGSGNVYIGEGIQGADGENDTCRIRSIFGQTAANGSAVFITSGNKLGTDTSSKRFKEEIKPMDKASEVLLNLKPVTFRYKKAIDPEAKSQFGLVAEDVEKVSPDLVVRDKDGKPYSVRYDQVNAMLLNEFLKAHKTVQELRSTVQKQGLVMAQQQKSFQSKLAEQETRIEALASGLQKVSAQLDQRKRGMQTVADNY